MKPITRLTAPLWLRIKVIAGRADPAELDAYPGRHQRPSIDELNAWVAAIEEDEA